MMMKGLLCFSTYLLISVSSTAQAWSLRRQSLVLLTPKAGGGWPTVTIRRNNQPSQGRRNQDVVLKSSNIAAEEETTTTTTTTTNTEATAVTTTDSSVVNQRATATATASTTPTTTSTTTSTTTNTWRASLAAIIAKFVTNNTHLHVVVTVVGATLLTFGLNNNTMKPLEWGPILASSTTGTLAALVLPSHLAMAAFCGSFAGMARLAVIPNWGQATILGTVCATMLTLLDHKLWLIGLGGRLGFVAQCACTLQFIVASLLLPLIRPTTITTTTTVTSSGTAALLGKFPSPITKVLATLPVTVGFTVAGALLMSFWKEVMAQQEENEGLPKNLKAVCQRLSGTVAASSVTGLVTAGLLPTALAGPAFCGSFIAMSSPAQLPTYGSMIGASIWGGIWQVVLSGVLLGGWGGKLGTAALLGVLSYKSLQKVVFNRPSKLLAPTSA